MDPLKRKSIIYGRMTIMSIKFRPTEAPGPSKCIGVKITPLRFPRLPRSGSSIDSVSNILYPPLILGPMARRRLAPGRAPALAPAGVAVTRSPKLVSFMPRNRCGRRRPSRFWRLAGGGVAGQRGLATGFAERSQFCSLGIPCRGSGCWRDGASPGRGWQERDREAALDR